MSNIPAPSMSSSWLTPTESANPPASAFDTENALKVSINRTAKTRPRNAGGAWRCAKKGEHQYLFLPDMA